MPKGDVPDTPSRSLGDTGHLIAKAALSAVPMIGGPAAELFAALVASPLERRRDAWMRDVGEALQDLQEKAHITEEQLSKNESFIDTALQASQLAMRNSQLEKRDALRNAVLNSALVTAPEESVQQFFLRLIDELTVWHLRLLRLFHDPTGWFEERDRQFPSLTGGGLSAILEAAYPELRGRREIYDQFWRDLYLRGLVTTEQLHTMMTGGGLSHSRTTHMGKDFLRFVEQPEILSGAAA